MRIQKLSNDGTPLLVNGEPVYMEVSDIVYQNLQSIKPRSRWIAAPLIETPKAARAESVEIESSTIESGEVADAETPKRKRKTN